MSSAMSGFPVNGLYAITDAQLCAKLALDKCVALALKGGARAIQYRDKSQDASRRLKEAGALVEICQTFGVPLIVNDDIALARASGADGVHLGEADGSLESARAALGPAAIIGISCYDSAARALTAQARGASYVAFGRFFPSQIKPAAVQANPSLVRNSRPRIEIPIVAIGGITPENGTELLAAGVDVLAVIHGVFGQRDPMAAAHRYATLF